MDVANPYENGWHQFKFNHTNISLTDDADYLYVSIEDDGKGFDTSLKRKGIGLANMSNRVESFNGEIKINSSPDNGCEIKITIPI